MTDEDVTASNAEEHEAEVEDSAEWGDWAREDELRTALARARADLENMRARSRKDQDHFYEAGRHDVFEGLLGVLDSIEGAREHGDLSEDNPLTAVVETLGHSLERLGLGSIGEVGDKFDPEIHDAVKVEIDPQVEAPVIKAVIQRGYGTQDRLLRATKVVVAQA